MKEKITKQRIIQVSEQILDQDGYETLTLAKVANALEIKTPSLYNHISGLNELRIELKHRALQLLKDRIMKASVGRSGKEALRAIGFAYIHLMNKRPGLFAAALSRAGLHDRAIEKEATAIIDIILRVLEPYHLSEEKAIHFVRGLRALAYGFSALAQQGGFNIDIPLKQSIAIAFDTYSQGLPDERRP
ncbi:MAG: WHG domain-containing protein [Sporolactobacillus sp.]|jgi:AcrR family transcriptional regulator|nr:WHG domain-containing protein [Sporolactobacillus sp.]